MALDPSIALGVQPIQLADPTNQLVKILQAQNLMTSNQTNQLQLQMQQGALQRQNNLVAALSDPGFASLPSEQQDATILNANPIEGPKILEARANIAKTRAETGMNTAKAADLSSQAALRNTQIASGFAATLANKQGLGYSDIVRARQELNNPNAYPDADPSMTSAQLQSYLQDQAQSQAGMTPKDRVDLTNSIYTTPSGPISVNRLAAPGTPYTVVPQQGASSVGAPAPAPAASPASAGAPGVPTNNVNWEGVLRASLSDPNPAMRAEAQARLVSMTPGLSPNFAQGAAAVPSGTAPAAPAPTAAPAPVAAPNPFQTFEHGTDPSTGQPIAIGKLPGPNGLPVVFPLSTGAPGTAGMSQAALDDAATRLLHGDQTVLANNRGAQGEAQNTAIRNRAADMARSLNVAPSDQTASTIALAGEKSGAQALGTRAANLVVAANELNKFSDQALDASAAVPRTSFVPLNQLTQMVASKTSSPEQAAFYAANESLINSFAQVAGRGTPTVAGQDHARTLLNTAQDATAYARIVTQLKAEAAAANEATTDAQAAQRARITGSSPGTGSPSNPITNLPPAVQAVLAKYPQPAQQQ